MRILYVFPHPDDESFGPALAIARQVREGHSVFLLTLTMGGATRQRHRLGLSVTEMGRVRLAEMRRVEQVLELSGMTVLDFPDSGLAEMDPRELEAAVEAHILTIRPQVVVTYPVHGVSGFPDHLVTHAVVKRVFCRLREAEPAAAPRRLALFTLAEADDSDEAFPLSTSPPEAIDVAEEVTPAEVSIAQEALACYETYQEMIRRTDPLGTVGRTVYFELFQESHEPRLPSITHGLEGK